MYEVRRENENQIIFLGLLFPVLSALANNNQLQGTPLIVTVGPMSDSACDYNSLATALLNDPDQQRIFRVASNGSPYESSIVIFADYPSLTIEGGYANCSDAAAGITSEVMRPIIYSTNNIGIDLLAQSGDPVTITLSNLVIVNNVVGLWASRNAPTDLVLENVEIKNNSGRGVIIDGIDVDVTLIDSHITMNQGGGLKCEDSALSSVRIEGNSSINSNISSYSGGGLEIKNGCDAHIYAPASISNNSANDHGGGVHVAGGSRLFLYGVIVDNNKADADNDFSGSGGGVYVTGSESYVYAPNTTFELNSAWLGGAFMADDQAIFQTFAESSEEYPCLESGLCVGLYNNTAQFTGGAFYASNGANILIAHAYISGSTALSSAVGTVESSAIVDMEGVMVVNNGNAQSNENTLSVNSSGVLNLKHVTLADNYGASSHLSVTNPGNLSVKSSIIHSENQTFSVVSGDLSSFDIECVIVSETDSFGPPGSTVEVNDPLFVDRMSGDYHLRPESPAIDYCYQAAQLTVGLGYDLDFEERNHDIVDIVNKHGAYDLGADESHYDSDLIFRDGF